MKVKELIRKLQKCDPEAMVLVGDKPGYSFAVQQTLTSASKDCIYELSGDPISCGPWVCIEADYEVGLSEHECMNGNHSGHHTPECRVGKERKDCHYSEDPRVKSHGKH